MKNIFSIALMLCSLLSMSQSGYYGKKNAIQLHSNLNLQVFPLDDISINFPIGISYERVLSDMHSIVLNVLTNSSNFTSDRYFEVGTRNINNEEFYMYGRLLDNLSTRQTAVFVDFRAYKHNLAPLNTYLSLGFGFINSAISNDPMIDINSSISNWDYSFESNYEELELSKVLEEYSFDSEVLKTRNAAFLNIGLGTQFPVNRYLTLGTSYNMSIDSGIINALSDYVDVEFGNVGLDELINHMTANAAARYFFIRLGFNASFVF